MALKFPHTFALLFGLLVVSAISTHFIPPGEYERIETEGREVVVPGSYHRVSANPAGFDDLFLAFPEGLIAVASIVFYIFIVGGAFGVINGTGAIETGIRVIVRGVGRFQGAVVPLLVLVFSLGGGSFGMAEEALPFLPALVILARSLGYDSIVAGAIGLAAASAGFGAAFLNPFTIGVAQGIAGLPLFSGFGYRFIVWLFFAGVTCFYISRYAARVKRNPESSLVYAIDQKRPALSSDFKDARLSFRQWIVLLLSVITLACLVIGAMKWGWGIIELSGLFIALSILAGPIGGLSINTTAEKFVDGAAALTGGALVVGLARGNLVLLSNARVIDTIMMALADLVREMPTQITVIGIYLVQVFLSVIVASGGGQAALSIPILAPLSDLIGVTRQTMVLAYQFGDGFTNILTPTSGYFMAGLALLGIPWGIWVRWLFPLICIWWAMGLAALLIAHAIHWGPF